MMLCTALTMRLSALASSKEIVHIRTSDTKPPAMEWEGEGGGGGRRRGVAEERMVARTRAGWGGGGGSVEQVGVFFPRNVVRHQVELCVGLIDTAPRTYSQSE